MGKYRDDDLLGRYPPVLMDSPTDHLLTDDQFERAWYNTQQVHFPNRWYDAERAIRSDRMARGILMARFMGDDHVDEEFDPNEALQLLEEALPHLPDELAERVRQLIER